LSSEAITYAFEQLQAPAGSAHSAADVLSAALAEADEVRAQARAMGEAEGRAAGIAAARAEAEPALAALAAAVQGIEQLRDHLIADLELDAVELAFQLCEQILAGVLSVQPERVVDVARNALRHLADRRQVTLVVNPDDLGVMADSVDVLQSQLGGIEHLAVQSDRRVARGGAIARTDSGEIDSGVDTQLQRAREIVVAALSPSSDAGTGQS
jgi:flagellar assembly protein FliH